MSDLQHQIDALNRQVEQLYCQGRYAQALGPARQVCDLTRQHRGEDHPDFAAGLDTLGLLHQKLGDHAEAEPLHRRALELFQRPGAADHPGFPDCLNNLALLCSALGNYAEAEALYHQALEAWRRTVGEDHPGFQTGLNNLAVLYQSMGDHARGETLSRRSLERMRATLGAGHPALASGLNGLALLCAAQGKYAEAEALYREALETLQTTVGERHPHFALGLNNLAGLYWEMGDPARAEPLCHRSLELKRVALGEAHPDFAAGLHSLALLYRTMDNPGRALPLCRRAVEIWRHALGEDHPDFAAGLHSLALLYWEAGDAGHAEPLYRQTLDVWRRSVGEDHPRFALGVGSLALLYKATGDHDRAEPLYRQALDIWRRTVGEHHPQFANALNNLAGLLIATGRAEHALPLMQQAAAVDDRLIGQVFSLGSESQRTAFLEQTRARRDGLLSLVLTHLPASPGAVRASLELILRRKGIGAEAQAAQRDAVLGGRYPDLQLRLRQWSALRLQIARQTLAGPGPEGPDAHRRHLADWHAQREQLEAALARQVPEMSLERSLRQADRRAVALALPEGATLVEFVRFDVFDFQAVPARGERNWQPARYLAFLLSAGDPDGVRMVDLGEAEPIDRLIELFRAGVKESPQARNMVRRPAPSPAHSGERAGQQLRAAVFDPLVAALGACRRLLLSPDGGLARLPFVVLPDAGGRLLIDSYRISYVNAGRDVLRFGAASSGTATDAVVVTDPDFDLAGAARPQPEAARGKRSRDLPRDRFHFDRLPGTRAEGEAVAPLLGVPPWQDVTALEGRLKQECRSPRILHLATHGFFLQDQPHNPNQERHDPGLDGGAGRLSGPLPENPLLRSGLALAGANTFLSGGTPPEEAEDGLLTAEDVSGLDLLATELVVLSACETGLGEVRTGEGVFGLQRAFTLAGAKTLVMSLWSVPDDATRELMEDFYKRILAGEGRADALRHAQLALRQKYPDPYFWGAFLCQGDPAPLRDTAHPAAGKAP